MFMRGETGTAPRPGGGVTLPTMGHTTIPWVFLYLCFLVPASYIIGEKIYCKYNIITVWVHS